MTSEDELEITGSCTREQAHLFIDFYKTVKKINKTTDSEKVLLEFFYEIALGLQNKMKEK